MRIPSIAWSREESVLLRELEHRHSNCIQRIAIAIARCGRQPTLEQTRVKLTELEERLYAHASLHKLLSDAPDPRGLESHWLALCHFLVRMFGREDITPYVYLDEAELSVVQAFWLSLIVAELVTNVLKHSLAQEGGSLWIDMRRLRGREVELRVYDSRKAPLYGQPLGEARIVNALVQILSGEMDVLLDDSYVTRIRVPLASERYEAVEAP